MNVLRIFPSPVKEINRLISKRTWIIYLKVTTEQKWRTQSFDFLSLRSLSPGQFLGRYCWILKLLVAILKSWEQNCVWIFYYFNFERNYDVLKSKNLCFLLNKNINFNRNEMEPKVENLTYTFRLMKLVLQLIWEMNFLKRTIIFAS